MNSNPRPPCAHHLDKRERELSILETRFPGDDDRLRKPLGTKAMEKRRSSNPRLALN
jgi:hypothetical protein